MILVFALPVVNTTDIVKWGITQIVCIGQTLGSLKNFATGSLNGGLWSVTVELQLYVVTAIIYKWVKKRKINSLITLMFFVATNLLYAYAPMPHAVRQFISKSFLPFGIWYVIGMLMYIYRDTLIPKLKKYVWFILAGFVLYRIVISSNHIEMIGYYSDIITSFVLPILAIVVPFSTKPIRFKNDFSYGIYLYHWCVLNILVHFGLFERCIDIVNLLLFMVESLIMGVLSWFCVEKRFVLKRRK